LASRDQAVEESRLAAVALIKGDPSEGQPVTAGHVVQLQADLPLRPVDQRLRNPLQGLGSHVVGHGDGLDALSGQVGELPLDINAEMMSCSIIDEALIEESEELLDSPAQGQDLVRLWQPPAGDWVNNPLAL